MIRRRRIEMHIERHELSIYSAATSYPSTPTPSANSPQTPGRTGSSREESVLLGNTAVPANTPELATQRIAPTHNTGLYCPICGAREMLPLNEAIALARLSATALKEGLETGRYHLHCSLTGEWLVCIQSLEQPLEQE